MLIKTWNKELGRTFVTSRSTPAETTANIYTFQRRGNHGFKPPRSVWRVDELIKRSVPRLETTYG